MAAKRINYKQLAARARKDFYNIIAYYPTKRNIDRLEEIFEFRKFLRRWKKDVRDPDGYKIFEKKLVPNAQKMFWDKNHELRNTLRAGAGLQMSKDYWDLCIRYYARGPGIDSKHAYKDPENVPGRAIASTQKHLTTPECKNHKFTKKRKQVQLEIEKFKKELYNTIVPQAVLKELYRRVFRYGIAYLKEVPILFRRGRGRNWKSRHGDGDLLGWWDKEAEKIYVRTRIENKPISEKDVYETIMHELMHAYSDSVRHVAEKLKEDFPEPEFEWFRSHMMSIKTIDETSEKFHKKMIKSQRDFFDRGLDTLRAALWGGDAKYAEYVDSASERYARGGSPLLRMHLNRIFKGKKGKQLNDDITGDDIFTACGWAVRRLLKYEDLGPLEFIWKSGACKSFKAQIGVFISQKTGKSWKNLTREGQRKYTRTYAEEIHAALEKKFKDDSDFKQKFDDAAENANRIAKNISRDPQREPRAIAEDKDLKELFKRFL